MDVYWQGLDSVAAPFVLMYALPLGPRVGESLALAALARHNPTTHLSITSLVRVAQKKFVSWNVWLRTLLRTDSHFFRALVNSQPRIHSQEVLFRELDDPRHTSPRIGWFQSAERTRACRAMCPPTPG